MNGPGISKTAIALAPRSADSRPIYRPIKCQISALFSSADKKINYNYLVIFFSIGRQFWGFGNRPMIGRRSADDRPISWPMSYLNDPHIIGRCVGLPSADHRSPLIIGRCVGRCVGRPSAD